MTTLNHAEDVDRLTEAETSIRVEDSAANQDDSTKESKETHTSPGS